jgi:hypothetical protein
VLEHPSGVKFTTPLLVPSFSSKGFPPTRDNKPWASRALEISGEWLTDTMLISAYDVHHGHIPQPSDLSFMPDLTIVDSGGYEAGFDEDFSAVAVRDHRPKDWSPDDLRRVLDAWPERFPAVFVSYDHPARRISVAAQISEAKELFGNYAKQMHSLLLKPEAKTQEYLKNVLKTVIEVPNMLAGFHIIGITEKELGSSLLDRMQRIAELRLALDGACISTPIQVFGALDPITSGLYFMSGAEIFDGLTWQRYAYHEGMCIYRANYGALTIGLDGRDHLVDGKTMSDNVNYLRKLELSMRRVVLDQDVRHFLHHDALFQQGFDDLRVKLKGRI